jgi:hypothetical protein
MVSPIRTMTNHSEPIQPANEKSGGANLPAHSQPSVKYRSPASKNQPALHRGRDADPDLIAAYLDHGDPGAVTQDRPLAGFPLRTSISTLRACVDVSPVPRGQQMKGKQGANSVLIPGLPLLPPGPEFSASAPRGEERSGRPGAPLRHRGCAVLDQSVPRRVRKPPGPLRCGLRHGGLWDRPAPLRPGEFWGWDAVAANASAFGAPFVMEGRRGPRTVGAATRPVGRGALARQQALPERVNPMARIAVATYLVLVMLADPCVCCCTTTCLTALLPGTLSGPRPGSVQAGHGCCHGHTGRRGGLGAGTSGMTQRPDRPECPCQEGPTWAAVAPSREGASEQPQRRQSVEQVPDALTLLPANRCPVAGTDSLAPRQRDAHPFLSAEDLLHALHHLRC